MIVFVSHTHTTVEFRCTAAALPFIVVVYICAGMEREWIFQHLSKITCRTQNEYMCTVMECVMETDEVKAAAS